MVTKVDAKPLVYVAGPITGDPFGCVRQSTDAFLELRELGVVPFCPQWSVIAEMVRPIHYEEWLSYDFDIIHNAAAVVRLPGESPGADREVDLARTLLIPVFFWPGDRDRLAAWAVASTERTGSR